MLRLKDVPPEQMPEVVRIANQLYEKDQRLAEQDQERDSYVNAAEELGVPKEYMERAAAELHRQKVIEAQDKQQTNGRKALIMAAVGAGVGAFLLVGLIGTTRTETRLAPPRVVTSAPPIQAKPMNPVSSPTFESFDTSPETRWTFDKNSGTEATVGFQQESGRGQVAVIRVERFGAVNGKDHRANFDSLLTPPSAGMRELTFDMRGEGLRKVRVYFERGSERWRSDPLTVPSGWSTFRVNLGNFQHQIKDGNRWRNGRAARPEVVDRVSFKFGDFMNPPTAKGEVRLDNIRFE